MKRRRRIIKDKLEQFAQLVSEIDISKYEQREFAHIVSLLKYEIFERSDDEWIYRKKLSRGL